MAPIIPRRSSMPSPPIPRSGARQSSSSISTRTTVFSIIFHLSVRPAPKLKERRPWMFRTNSITSIHTASARACRCLSSRHGPAAVTSVPKRSTIRPFFDSSRNALVFARPISPPGVAASAATLLPPLTSPGRVRSRSISPVRPSTRRSQKRKKKLPSPTAPLTQSAPVQEPGVRPRPGVAL